MNRLFFGDNLDVLRERVPDESVDLVYLDPPFNSKVEYNIIYNRPENSQETAQRSIFRDTWKWEDEAQFCFEHVLLGGGKPARLVEGLVSALGRTPTMAYLVTMGARLIQIHKTLKPTGAVFLHCDPTASHYLKLVMDAIFGEDNFLNEVVWKRSSAHNSARRFGPVHDNILYYSAGGRHTWNKVFQAYDQSYVDAFYTHVDKDGRRWRRSDLTGAGTRNGETGQPWRGIDVTGKGRHWAWLPADLDKMEARGRIHWPQKQGGMPMLKRYLDEQPGVPAQDIISDVPAMHNLTRERLGYPTQKPRPLLERLISAASNEGDVVLDPYCGCGTTVEAAQRLNRNWIGVDISYYSVRLIQRRMQANIAPDFPIEIDGIPADLVSAYALADRNPYGFQQWAVGELGCQLWNNGKKGADTGIDGEMWFFGGPNKIGKMLVQVKGGKRVGPDKVREFAHVLAREQADVGIFFMRGEPTTDMKRDAVSTGFFRIGSRTYPRLQIVSLASWFAGQRPDMPPALPMKATTDRAASVRKHRRPDPKQPEFTFVMPGLESLPDDRVFNPRFVPDELLREG